MHPPTAADPRRMALGPLVNMNFGFLGIQFGWALQQANMTPIYRVLGAHADGVPLLWLAAPLTGLVVQPVIGAMSDRTWTRLGRRRPYFLVGAVLASLALALMPSVTSVGLAALLLWVMDASINVSMEPFRAFVADKLAPAQRTEGFVMQSLLIGVGSSVASAMPWVLSRLGVHGAAANGIPQTVRVSFWLGAAAFLTAVLWTVFTTREDPPEIFASSSSPQPRSRGGLGPIVDAVRTMPRTMRRLAGVQVFTWLGLFCMWLFFADATARRVFGATSPRSELYERGVAWAGVCFAGYSVVNFVVSLGLGRVARALGRRATHALALSCGGAALLAVAVVHSPYVLLATIALGVGVAWSSILSMPYAMLTSAIPRDRAGVYMGLFNFFIVLPEIVAALCFQPLVRRVFHGDVLRVVMLGGGSLFVAAALVATVPATAEP